MVIKGVQELTLLDYPGHMAATIFLGGCDYRCPFCHNASIVERPKEGTYYDQEEVLSFLKTRRHILEGVCVTGGEPLLNADVEPFIKTIKELGYDVKLDTNGNHPDRLKKLVEEHYVDYVAVDIKNCKEKYGLTNGLPHFSLHNVEETVDFLMTNVVPFEFRTTVVQEFHTADDFKAIGAWIKGPEHYYLQGFVDSGDLICEGLHAWDKDTMIKFRDVVREFVPNTEIRGLE